MDKHRTDSVGPHDLRFTLLDDYLHVVDTALWLAGAEARLQFAVPRRGTAVKSHHQRQFFFCRQRH
ncbi:virulence factor MviM, partial [Salmonella enterica subsp. enterica serovar Bareilly str. CFSAN000227]